MDSKTTLKFRSSIDFTSDWWFWHLDRNQIFSVIKPGPLKTIEDGSLSLRVLRDQIIFKRKSWMRLNPRYDPWLLCHHWFNLILGRENLVIQPGFTKTEPSEEKRSLNILNYNRFRRPRYSFPSYVYHIIGVFFTTTLLLSCPWNSEFNEEFV